MTEHIGSWQLCQRRMWETIDKRAQFIKIEKENVWAVKCISARDERLIKSLGLPSQFCWFLLSNNLKESVEMVAHVLDCSLQLRMESHSGYAICGTGYPHVKNNDGLFVYRGDDRQWYVRAHPSFVADEYQQAIKPLNGQSFATRKALLIALEEQIKPPPYY